MKKHGYERTFTFGKMLKYLFIGISLFIYVFGIYILITNRDTKIATDFVWTPEALTAYREAPEEFDIYKLEVMTNYTRDGRFFVVNTRYAENISQIQFTVKFNNSTLRAIEEDYAIPSVSADDFYYVLSDNLGNCYTSYRYLIDTDARHCYRRLVFDDVSLIGIDTLTVQIYHGGDTGILCGELVIYKSENQSRLYGLKRRERPSEELQQSPGLMTYSAE